ncbi:hypothetical protein HPB50_027590 [Hyalomma asiaticum]|uniref:Uncharacterized protein n=1 Tax=Hyalomma asiaticum TaxID=266040 RepID=A0ACB7T0Q3_HYAAI|nr:hypothetical protein HPB50_027590 [Hyalomma asiaticum]
MDVQQRAAAGVTKTGRQRVDRSPRDSIGGQLRVEPSKNTDLGSSQRADGFGCAPINIFGPHGATRMGAPECAAEFLPPLLRAPEARTTTHFTRAPERAPGCCRGCQVLPDNAG